MKKSSLWVYFPLKFVLLSFSSSPPRCPIITIFHGTTIIWVVNDDASWLGQSFTFFEVRTTTKPTVDLTHIQGGLQKNPWELLLGCFFWEWFALNKCCFCVGVANNTGGPPCFNQRHHHLGGVFFPGQCQGVFCLDHFRYEAHSCRGHREKKHTSGSGWLGSEKAAVGFKVPIGFKNASRQYF